MDERVNYAAFAIPQREAQTTTGAFAHNQKSPDKPVLSTDAGFAEIEYESRLSSVSSIAPAQPIGVRAVDPIREKFFGMRKLASGVPFARNDSGIFYKQAKIMEDYTDDYDGNAQFSMYYPYYQLMGYEQLRTYFSWRTKVRLGEILPTSLSYVFLYIYELLSGIGVKTPAEGLQKLMAIWNAFREREHALDRYLPGWLKDYHVYYALPHSFEEFVNEHSLHRYYSDAFLFESSTENSLELWNGISSYDITKSKFYHAGNDALMRDCFSFVLNGIRALCASRNRRIEDLLMSGFHSGTPWHPFQQALFHPWLHQPDRQVQLSMRETYSCTGNRWTAYTAELYWKRKELVGYLLKKTEACLRKATKYKFRITAHPSAFTSSLERLIALSIPLEELDATIEKAVTDFHRNLTRTVVIVDHEHLHRIRKEALGTQDKLIVSEDEAPSALIPIQVEQSEPYAPFLDGWAALKEALNQVERKALSMALRGGMDMKAYAVENGVMLEVLADSINEKAADTIGDNIMDLADDMILYDEYREKVAKMVG